MSPVREAEERLRVAERERDLARDLALEAMRLLTEEQRRVVYRTLNGSQPALAPA